MQKDFTWTLQRTASGFAFFLVPLG
jgi:hypothetical protein